MACGRCSGMSIARFGAEARQAAVFPAAQVLDDRGERLPLDVLHGVVVDAALAADAEDGHDVRVVQAGGGLRFVLEALQLPGIERGGKRQHLERDAATE